MKKLQRRIKGFTLTELAIVIAVIAILVAVLVPTFIALIDKANKSSDSLLVSYINDALNTENAGSGTEQVEVDIDGNTTSVYNVVDAISSLSDYGYSISSLTTKADGADIVYNATTNSFIYYTEDFTEITYGTEPSENDVLVVITDSSLSRQSAVESSSSVISGKGVNYCVYSEDSEVNLANSTTEDTTIWLYTVTGSIVTIDVPNGTVYQYGEADKLTVNSVASDSLHAYGKINALTMVSGHYQYEEGGEVKYLYVANDNSSKVTLTLGTSTPIVLSDASTTISGYTGNVEIIAGITYDNIAQYNESVADYSGIFSLDEEKTVDATCSQTGSYTYTSVFGTTVTVTIAKVAHTYGEAVTENEVAAKCETNGSYDTVVYCTVCGEEISRATTTVAATGHSYVFSEWNTGNTSAIYKCEHDETHTITIDATVATYAPTTEILNEYSTCSLSSSYAVNVYTVTYNDNSVTTAAKNTSWSYTSGTTELKSYSGTDTVITIPEGTTSTYNKGSSSCIISNSTTKTTLTSVTLPESLVTLGDYAFNGCTALTSVTLSSGLTTINQYAFKGCTTLASISIPDSVSIIGTGAFYSCSGLTSISIGTGLDSINSNAFYGCTSLSNLYITNLTKWCKVQLNAMTSSPMYSCLSGTEGNLYLNGKLVTNLEITGIADIGAYSFINCASIETVTLGSGVKTIGNSAFMRCTGLESLTVGADLNSIDNNAFSDCTSLRNLYITSLVKWCNVEMSSYTAHPFYKCMSDVEAGNAGGKIYLNGEELTSLDLSFTGVTYRTIGAYAFSYCTYITEVTIGSNITTIGEGAFLGCLGITSITIPEGITSIGKNAFKWCKGLTEINYNATNVTTTGSDIFYGAGLSGDGITLTIGASVQSIPGSLFYGNSNASYSHKITTVVFAENSVCASIGDKAFQYSVYLTSIKLGDNVTSIGSSAFYSCTALTSVTLGSELTTIGDEAFKSCSALTSITIPANVISIGRNAFNGCSALTSVTFSDTSGWYCSKTESATSGTSLTVTTASTNATYLTSSSKYLSYYWYKSST